MVGFGLKSEAEASKKCKVTSVKRKPYLTLPKGKLCG